MTTPSGSTGSGPIDLSNPVVGAAISALPPEVQELLKPGKTSDRIQHAITWAARRDPKVVARHHARNPNIRTFEDIASAPLAQMDAVAQEIARGYRRRALLTGAVTGLPGGLWAVVAAGADVQLTAVYAARMGAQVAQAYGYDTSLLEEQAHLAEVLALMAGIDTLRGIGNTLGREGLEHLLPQLLPRLLARVSVELTEDQAAKWIGRVIPGVGALVGASIDYGFLRVAGQRAVGYYHNRYLVEHGLAAPAGAAALPAGRAARGQIVEGSLATPAQSAAPATAASALPTAPASSAASRATAAMVPLEHRTNPPINVPRRHRRPPERFALYLGLFAFFFFVLTAAACAALAYLVIHAIVVR